MARDVTRADGVLLPREKPLRGRDYFSMFGKFAAARTCYRRPREPGIFPLDAQVNLPERCYSYFLQEWRTLFEVEHPFKESARWFEQLFDLEVAESVLMLARWRPRPVEPGDQALQGVAARDGRCARSRRATTMIPVTIGGSVPVRSTLASTVASRNTGPRPD